MRKLLTAVVLTAVSLFSQITSIPGGGGKGTIPAGRVAFGAGTSTPATDSQFVWDNTNKRFQVGSIGSWAGYESHLTASVIKADTAATVDYDDRYPLIVEYNYGDAGTGSTGVDLYPIYSQGIIGGNSDTTFYGGGIVSVTARAGTQNSAAAWNIIGARGAAFASDSSSANALYGVYSSVSISGTATATNVYGNFSEISNTSSGTSPTNAYGHYISAVSGGSNNWNIYSAAGTGDQARNYFGGNTGIGKNSDTPTSTLYVKDGTASTGATTVVFDIGAGQSSTSTILTLGGVIRFNGQNTTGAGSAALGSNSPAVTNTAPYTWIRIVTSDGSTAYIPAWK